MTKPTTGQDCGEAAGNKAAMAGETAFELFQIAALLLGSEQGAVSAVEEALANAKLDPCTDKRAAHDEILSRLLYAAMGQITRGDAGAFAAPLDLEIQSTCIDADDLSSAGLTGEQLNTLIDGPGRARMREWLERLAPAPRTVFVLRAILGQNGEQTAEGLRRSEAMGAQSWTSDSVGNAYRQALCSLASSLLNSDWAVPA